MSDHSPVLSRRPSSADPFIQHVLSAIRSAGHAGITSQQLALQLGIKEKSQRYRVFDAIDALLDEGRIETGKKGRYTVAGGKDSAEGTIDIISSGAGYVRLGTGEEDVYVQQRDLGTALHGDLVAIKLVGGRGSRLEGKVVKVLKRRRIEFVGTVHKHQGRMILVADDQRVRRPFVIPAAEVNGAVEGDKAIIELGEWKDARDEPRGKVVRVLGRAGEHQVEMHAILAEFGLPLEFPESVLKASEEIRNGATPDEVARRRDVRYIPTITIDPDDAKDLDDALSVHQLENGHWEIGVHIADVSHYVKPGSVLDMEAANRATSVYLVDRVVPMLPEKLSNDLCSLHADTDKLSFSAIFEMDDQARIKHEWFGRTVMRSRRRFAYQEAQAIIDGKGEGAFQNEVLLLHRLAQVLRKERISEGALEIGGNEVKFKLDEGGKPLGVYEKVMGPANWLIEEFMLLANKRVATWVNKRPPGKEGHHQRGARPFIYRIHDQPDPEKIDQLRALAKSFGHTLRHADMDELPHAINELLNNVRGTEEENIIKQVAIRSMAKAIYSTENIGHYGLAFEHYTHFTSPIRRYPDLLVHRAMAHYLAGGAPLDQGELELSCSHSSRMEKQASDAERASIRYKQAEYMLARIGQTFDGIVSGLTSWGVYVELRENKCEGLIGLRDIPGDVFRFDKERYIVVGQRTGRKFRLGDELEVMIKAVDMDRRVVDFSLSGAASPAITTSGKFERRSIAPRKASSKGKKPKQAQKGKKGKKRR